MSTELHTAGPEEEAEQARAAEEVESLVEDEVLVEEISIDGMCGVY